MTSTFRAMGSEVIVHDDEDYAAFRLGELEAYWSRFRPSSDISRLNRAEGHTLTVHRDTLQLLAWMKAAFDATNGSFDPGVLPLIQELGYTESYFAQDVRTDADGADVCQKVPFIAGLIRETIIDEQSATVTAHPHLRLDPGAIGKGLAADIIAAELDARGATDIMVSIGGDVRTVGVARTILIEDPWDATKAVSRTVMLDGGVATSSVLAKKFTQGSQTRSHIVSPHTGESFRHDVIQVSVLANMCAWAEVFATACIVDGSLTPALTNGLAAVLVRADGTVERTANWHEVS